MWWWLLGGLVALSTLTEDKKKMPQLTRPSQGNTKVLDLLPYMQAAQRSYPNVKLSLACAIAENESGGNTNAVRWECRKDGKNFGGKTGCPPGCQRVDAKGRPIMSTGAWQFLIGTGESYGLRSTIDPATDERRDPAKSTLAAFHFFSDLLKKFNGDETAAIAAYNAGSGGVASYRKKHGGTGVPNQAYVDHITAKRQKYLSLDG